MTKINDNARGCFRQFLLAQHNERKSSEYRNLTVKLRTEGLDLIELQIHRMLHESGYLHHVILKQQ
jgi:hypothetical protein